MKFTFTDEERKAIELTRAALMVIKKTMDTAGIDSLFEPEDFSGFTYGKVDDAADLLADLLDGKVWEEDD